MAAQARGMGADAAMALPRIGLGAGTGSSMGLSEMAAIAWCRKGRALAALLAPIVLAALLLAVLPPKYDAQSDIMVKTGREYLADDGNGTALTAPTSTKQEGINSEIELLTSRPVIKAAIDAIGLAELYPGLLESPPWFGSIDDAAIDKFTKDLTVEPVKLSNVISVSFAGSSPAKAEHVLDTLIKTYIDTHAQVFAGSRSESYADAVNQDISEIARLEADRTRVKLENGIYDINAQRSALISQRVAAQTHLQNTVDLAASMRARLQSFADYHGSAPARTMHTASSVPSDESMRAQQTLVDLRAAEAKMAAHFGSGYPELQSVREQIASLERRASTTRDRVNVTTAPSPLLQQIDSEMVMDRAQLAPLEAEQSRYAALVASLTAELQRLEAADLQLRTLTTRVDAMTDTLRLTQTRYGQARMQEQMDLARHVSVVQVAPAQSPEAAAKPKKLLVMAAGILLGILAGGGVLVLAIVTSNTVVTEEGAERLLGMPVLLALPLMQGLEVPVTLPVG